MSQPRQPLTLAVVGISYRTAPVEEREGLAFTPAELPPVLSRLRHDLGAAVLLSTCNRTELYVTVPQDEAQSQRLVQFLLSLKEVQLEPSRFYVLHQEDAVRHLYRVAAGIDSMVLGEAQVLGQVRDALSAATEAGSLNGIHSRLFHTALSVGKRARRQSEIGQYAVSVSSTAVALAKKIFGSLVGRGVLVISAGSTGKLAGKALAEIGASPILVTNRTYRRATELARSLGGRAIPFNRLPQALAESDIVISATGAKAFVLGPGVVRSTMAGRNGRPLLLIDIAVPRDISPVVASIPGVHLFDIDDLQKISIPESRGNGRQRAIAQVEAIIEEEVSRFQEWWRSQDVVPIITALRQQAESIRRQELEKTWRRLPGLSQDERQRIEALTAAIVKKMLHQPTVRLKEGADVTQYVEALEELFGVSSGLPRS